MSIIRFLSVEKSLFSEEPITVAWLLSIGGEQVVLGRYGDTCAEEGIAGYAFTNCNGETLLVVDPPGVTAGGEHVGGWSGTFDSAEDYSVPDEFHVRSQVARLLWARGYEFPTPEYPDGVDRAEVVDVQLPGMILECHNGDPYMIMPAALNCEPGDYRKSLAQKFVDLFYANTGFPTKEPRR